MAHSQLYVYMLYLMLRLPNFKTLQDLLRSPNYATSHGPKGAVLTEDVGESKVKQLA